MAGKLDSVTIEWIGVELSVFDEGQRHIGVLYRSLHTGEVRLLDLKWHHRMSDRLPSGDGLTIQSGLDSMNAQLMAIYCQTVVEANAKGEIPYGIGFNGDEFDPLTGEWIYEKEGEGLTCATFVMALFEAQGFSLLEREDWRFREEDERWQEEIVGILERNAPAEHLRSQQDKIGKSVRYRPEEVAAGVESENPPLSFESAEKRGKDLLEILFSIE